MSETYRIYAYHCLYCNEMGGSMHLASEHRGEANDLLVLNGGCGVLFADAEPDGLRRAGTTKILINPRVFRLADGSFGITALKRNIGPQGKALPEPGKENFVLFYRSDDLISFTRLSFIEAAPSGTLLFDADCRWDGTRYILSMETDKGPMTSTSAGLGRFEKALPGGEPIVRHKIAALDSALSCAFDVSGVEYQRLIDHLTPVHNIGVEPIQISASAGKSVVLPDACLLYSDGSRRSMRVEWDSFNAPAPGTYKVKGRIKAPFFSFPVMGERGDPMAVWYRGFYYYMASDDEGGQLSLKIRKAGTIGEIACAEDMVILPASDLPWDAACFWAPELHEIEGRLFLFFAVGSPHWYTVQSHVMALNGEDPANPGHWSKPVRCERKDGTHLIEDGITLDMTVLKVKGDYYALWAQRFMGSDLGNIGSSDLYIARIDPEKPWRQVSEAVLLRRPLYSWERAHSDVIEGPFVLKRGEDIFVTYAAALIDHTYCVGLLRTREGSDLLDPQSWTASNYPVLHRWSHPEQIGAGHNSFVKNEHGDDILMIHAIPLSHYRADPADGRRYPAFRAIHWDASGFPRLDMTNERLLDPAFETIEAAVILT
ncbi:MAG TPA: family 43 glycosylhydrolase [Treponemataceae bacterium]|nr:family 43 glycosylhydrolase [Treponemataceae bacterium]